MPHSRFLWSVHQWRGWGRGLKKSIPHNNHAKLFFYLINKMFANTYIIHSFDVVFIICHKLKTTSFFITHQIQNNMKTLLIAALLILSCGSSYAQNAEVTIVNNTDFDIRVTMYADATSSCTTGTCNTTFITNNIGVSNLSYPASPTTWGPYDPCDIVSSPGWATVICPTVWCSSIPSDFQWTLAKVEIPTGYGYWDIADFPLWVCSSQPTCFPGAGTTSLTAVAPGGPFSAPNVTAYWTSSGGSLADVTITVNQY